MNNKKLKEYCADRNEIAADRISCSAEDIAYYRGQRYAYQEICDQLEEFDVASDAVEVNLVLEDGRPVNAGTVNTFRIEITTAYHTDYDLEVAEYAATMLNKFLRSKVSSGLFDKLKRLMQE